MSAMENSDRLWGVEAAAPQAAGVAIAPWWRRFAALIIDIAWAIQVRDAATGGPLGYPKAAVRYLAPTALMLIPILGFFLWLAEGFTPFMDHRRRALHDKVAGSMVVDAT